MMKSAPSASRAAFLLVGLLTLAVTALAVLVVTAIPATAHAATAKHQYVVVIDAGHQGKADLRTEPIGPGSSTRKPRVEGGASGVATHRPESLDNLQIALKLRDQLVKRGVKVIMVRTTQNVDISNAKRAQIANAAHADLFIRLHCDSSTNSSVRGVLTLVPAKTRWTGKITTASARAGKDVQKALVSATHDRNRGITKRSDLTGFNWSKVPTVLVEMGVMSNPAEDRKLATPAYQKTLAAGMANGIMAFLAGK